MKRILLSLSMAAAGFVFAACQVAEVEPQAHEETVQVHTVTFTSAVEDTKTTMTEGAEYATFQWSAEDASRFHVYENGVAAKTTDVSISDNIATVTATFANTRASSYTYTAYVNSSESLEVPAAQTLTDGAYDENAELLVADPVTETTAPQSLLFTFRRATSTVKMTLKGLSSGEVVSKVVVTSAESSLAGSLSRTSGEFENGTSTITLTGSVTADASGNAPIYFMCTPADAATLTLEVTTDKGIYRKTLAKALSFPQRTVVRFGVGLANYLEVNFSDYDAITVAEVKALITSTSSRTIYAYLTDAIVTAVNSDGTGYIEDTTAGLYLYKCASSLSAGTAYSGAITFKGQLYSKVEEITSVTLTSDVKTVSATIPYKEMTISDIIGDLGGTREYADRRVKIVGATISGNLSGSNSSVTLSQDDSSVSLFSRASDADLSSSKTYDIYCYPQLYKGTTNEVVLMANADAVEHDDSTDPVENTISVSARSASDITSVGATLNASFSEATAGSVREVGFYWGTSSSSLSNELYVDESFTGTSGSYSGSLTSLSANTTYYYKAYVITTDLVYHYSSVLSFTTSADSSDPGTAEGDAALGHSGWLEMPAASAANSNYFYGTFYGTSTNATTGAAAKRNYTYLYDKSMYTAYWVAYPLYSATTGGSRSGSWAANPVIDETYQVDCWTASYNVALGSTKWSSSASSADDYYARGHQIPDADRSNNSVMQSQTYFATNSTPQIQNKFNGGIWMYLEAGVRSMIPSSDTLYVVTGASFQKVGETKTITKIYPKGDENKATPVPNYYWKVLLKVTRSGSTVTSASAIGFWLEHKQYSDNDYTDYAVSVDTIEQYTGFDFFANLPESVEKSAESNSSLTTFQNF